MTMRKRLEMGAMSYGQGEQQLSQLSLPFDFKIQCIQYHMSPKKSMAVPHEVAVREDRKNAQSSLKVKMMQQFSLLVLSQCL